MAMGIIRTRRGKAADRQLPPELAAEATWDRLHQRFAEGDDLDDDLRLRALGMLGRLRPILGEDWPARVYGLKNPLAECLFNSAPHAIASMVQIGHAIVDLQDVGGWAKVVGRARGTVDHEATSAIAELLVGSRAARFGLPIAFEPSTDRGRHADLLVGVAGDPVALYVEVCVKDPLPEIAKNTESVENAIIPPFDSLTLNLARGGRFLRAPEEWEIAPLADQVATFMRQATSSNGVQQLTVPGLLELRVVRIDDPVHSEAVDAGLVGDFRGIVFEHSPFARLASAVRTKSAQLLANGAGLLVITPPSFLGQPPPTEQLVAELQAVLRDIPRVVALALLGRQLASPASDVSQPVGDAILVQRVIYPPIVERVLFIPNPIVAGSNQALQLARRIMCAAI